MLWPVAAVAQVRPRPYAWAAVGLGPSSVWITAAVIADKMAPSNGCHCSETGNSGRDPQKLSTFLCRAKSVVRGKYPQPCRRELCDSDVSWPLLLEALLDPVVGLVLPRMRH